MSLKQSSLSATPRQLPNHLSPIDELKPFALVKLIVFDVDGTLVETYAQPVDRLIADFQRSLAQSSTHITFATGRAFNGVRPLFDSFPDLQRNPIALYNGSVVVHIPSRSVISHQWISSNATQFVVEIAKKHSTECLVYRFSDRASNISERYFDETVEVAFGRPEALIDINGLPYMRSSSIGPGNQQVTAILLRPPSDHREVVLGELTELDDISVTVSGATYIEVRPRGVNKAVACATIARILNVPQKETLAIGDADNDVDMLTWCEIGVAVRGASEAARMASQYVTASGPMESAIELLNIIKAAKRFRRHWSHP